MWLSACCTQAGLRSLAAAPAALGLTLLLGLLGRGLGAAAERQRGARSSRHNGSGKQAARDAAAARRLGGLQGSRSVGGHMGR